MKTLPGLAVSQAVGGDEVIDFSVSGSEAERGTTATASTASANATAANGPAASANPAATQSQPPQQYFKKRSTDHVEQNGPPPRMGKHCRFLIAAALFAAANLLLSFGAPFDFDPYRFVYRGWAWWTMQDLRNDTEVHNVALLGSSLVVSAIAGSDANHLTKSLDLTAYHKAAYLDYLLHNKLNGEFNTFNLSAPGQMPSDAYLTLKGMVNVSQRPEVVIYGIAPRDFIDSQLSSPVDTEPFRYLRRIVNIDDVATGLYRSPIPRLDWCLQRSVYMYGNSLDIQMSTNELAMNVMSHVVPQPEITQRPFTWWDRTRVLPNYLPGEIIPNSMLAVPITHETAIKQYTDNSKEYRERYKRPDPSIYQTQFYFLRKLCAFCKKEKIELVLVNMPLTQTNISLLNPTVYLQYLQAIKNFGYSYNIPVLDMCNFTDYSKDDFHDTVHLNGFGGKKFLWRLASMLTSMPRTRQALMLAGEELSRHKQVASPKPSVIEGGQ